MKEDHEDLHLLHHSGAVATGQQAAAAPCRREKKPSI